jgi:hypothetical protein
MIVYSKESAEETSKIFSVSNWLICFKLFPGIKNSNSCVEWPQFPTVH